MQRRSLLAGVAALAAGAGCSRLVPDDSVSVRAMPVPDDVAADEDAHCDLSESFVSGHPVLERVLQSAQNAPDGEWVTADTDRETAETLLADIHEHCVEPGGVYHYHGDGYYVQAVTEDGDRVTASSASSEAIRGAHADDYA